MDNWPSSNDIGLDLESSSDDLQDAPSKRQGHDSNSEGLLPAVQSLLYVLIVAQFLMAFTVQPIRIPSASMEPTLLVGDFLLLDKQQGAIDATWLMPPVGVRHGDVVVFHDPSDNPEVHLVKRVIGVPGDRIHLRNGIVYRNDEPLAENYALYRKAPLDVFRDDFPNLQTMDARVKPKWWIKLRGLVQNGDITVPDGNYFVMGDNRNDSEDSRYWGFVPRNAIVGRPVMIYFSWRQGDVDANEVESAGRPYIDHSDPLQKGIHIARWDRTFRIIK